MRNTLKYPVTKKEIMNCLERFMFELGHNPDGSHKEERIGDIRPWLLSEAIDVVEKSDYNENSGPIENWACNDQKDVT